jgi:hypothetical protein
MTEPIEIAGVRIQPGRSAVIRVPVTQRLTTGQVEIAARVVHGRRPGPRLFVSAALHGDEINGTEILRRLLGMPLLRRLRGTLVAVPVVNVYGFVSQQRYLPDRRDLNRSFPGSARGSLAARVAYSFLTNFVEGSTHGIDLHTGAIHRTNLPQIRVRLSNPAIEDMARAFGAPVILNSPLRPGSLRAAADDLGIPTLVYEAGEALRFDEFSIRAGIRGIVSVMRHLEMLPRTRSMRRVSSAVISHKSVWIRAPDTGMLTTQLRLGATIQRREVLGSITDPFGENTRTIRSPVSGVLIGRTNLPLANEGDALFHVGTFDRIESVAEEVDAFREDLELDPLDDEGPARTL